MIKLDTPVSAISKIGPKYKFLLQKLNIFTIEDLLYHFPFRFDDYSSVKKISDLKESEQVTISGILGPVENIYTRYGKKLTKSILSDSSGNIELVWFNQQYLKKTLFMGNPYNVSGKVGRFGKKLTIISPEMEDISKQSRVLNTARLVSIYPETSGLSSKWIRSRINDLLGHEIEFEEFLPKEIINKYSFSDIKQSLFNIHFPKKLSDYEKARERFAYEEMFLELLNVERKKDIWNKKLKGKSFKINLNEVNKLIKTLPFELTDSQKQSLEEIYQDLSCKYPMNRLLEGDVGTGKTMVALISAYATHLNGYQSLYMAPTEILARQHFETFKKYLPNLNIVLLTGNTSKKNSKDMDKIKDADIVIGTHAILYSDYDFSKVGFVTIDEQHRFGVEQRGKIVEMGSKGFVPHLLTMTATPIPRTLALTIYGDLSISVLKTHPNANRKIITKIVPENQREQAFNWILEKQESTFIVCPFIEESESEQLTQVKAAEAEFIKLKNGIFKNTPMGLLHGKMKNSEKEVVVNAFRNGDIKILVSTPVIEVGIDIPDAVVIVIESAERYGLASLHQLRGRVGRGEKAGYCFAFMSESSRKAYTRLKYLESIQNGLELAEIDMSLRGHGDIFGIMQHGFKKFRVADIEDLSFVKKVKKDALEYFKNIDKYPILKNKLDNQKSNLVKNN